MYDYVYISKRLTIAVDLPRPLVTAAGTCCGLSVCTMQFKHIPMLPAAVTKEGTLRKSNEQRTNNAIDAGKSFPVVSLE